MSRLAVTNFVANWMYSSAIVFGLTLGSSASAQKTEALSEKTTARYEKGLPTASARDRARLDQQELVRKWVRVDFFKESKVEIVRNGTIDPNWGGLLAKSDKFQRWLTDSRVSLNQFEWLQLRELDLMAATVKFTANGVADILIPIAYGIRYKMSSFRQGTLTVLGSLKVQIDRRSGRIYSIQIDAFDDSQDLERISRQAGLLAMFNADFIEGLALPILMSFFNQPQNLDDVLEKSGALGHLGQNKVP